jgi:hypothetical protein
MTQKRINLHTSNGTTRISPKNLAALGEGQRRKNHADRLEGKITVRGGKQGDVKPKRAQRRGNG